MADEPIYLAQQTDLDAHKDATGNVHGMVKGDIGLGNVDNTADKDKSVKHATTAGSLATARTITLTGDVSGSVSFNGSKDVSIEVTVADDSHNHTIANIDGLQTALDGKETSGAAATALTNAKSYTNSAVSTHNTSTSAHSDLRDLIAALQTKLNNFLDVDDTTTDQLSELIALIQDNATDIEAITSGKVNVSDIVNNLTTNVANKPLSAAQGVALKALIDALQTAVDGKASSSHTHSAYVNQNAFSNVKVGSTTIVADTATDTLTLVAGSNITLTPDATNDKVTIAAKDTVYTHPSYTAKSSGFYKVTVDATGHVSDTEAVTKTDITGLGIPAQDTTYSAATTSAAGLMSAADKTKLNATNVAWGTCSTEAATAAKVITISGNTNWALTAGAIIAVKFSATNTAANPTFNVNGTGAKSVWYSAAVLTTSSLSYAGYKDRPCFYVYDGTQFVFLGWSYDANTTYTNVKLGHGYATCSTAAATAAKVGTLSSYTLVTGGIVAVKFTYAVPANATLNINSKGAKAIYHRGAKITAGVINAGDTATFMYNGSYYHLLSVDSEPTNIATLQSKVSALETKVAELEALLAYYVGIDSTGPYIEEGE